MQLDERSRVILQYIIEQYIQSAEPVGSRALSKIPKLGLSAATIRNVMSDLTEQGLIHQPHTSAGRIPTDAGYRFYVDHLSETTKVAKHTAEPTSKDSSFAKLEDLLIEAANQLFDETQFTSLVLTPKPEVSRLKKIELIALSAAQILVVIITQSGQVKNKILSFKDCPDQEQLSRLADHLSSSFADCTLDTITERLLTSLAQGPGDFTAHEIRIGKKVLETFDHSELYIAGRSQLCAFPEFADQKELESIYQTLEEKDDLKVLFADAVKSRLFIQIGEENKINGLGHCSVVATPYGNQFYHLGSLGIIGPTRMNYPKVIEAITRTSNRLTDSVSRFIHD